MEAVSAILMIATAFFFLAAVFTRKKWKNMGLCVLSFLAFIVVTIASDPSFQIAQAGPPSSIRIVMPEARIPEGCRNDLTCWGERHHGRATQLCSQAIQAQAAGEYRWKSGLFTDTLSGVRWRDMAEGILAYDGNAIEFSTPSGRWRQQTYQCEFNTRDGTLGRVYVAPL